MAFTQTIISYTDCQRSCRTMEYPYMGLEGSTECYCGVSYGKCGTATNCNLECYGSQCGGSWANSVYPVSGELWELHEEMNSVHLLIHSHHQHWIDGTYLGCFLDSDYTLDAKGSFTQFNVMTVDKCYDFCFWTGKQYFGVQNGPDCQCSAVYYGGSAVTCGMKCVGNRNQIRGNVDASSVYVICKWWRESEECVCFFKS